MIQGMLLVGLKQAAAGDIYTLVFPVSSDTWIVLICFFKKNQTAKQKLWNMVFSMSVY